MKCEPVHITGVRGPLVLSEFVAYLARSEIETIVASLDAHHLHILARFRDHNPREHLGGAKKHSSHILRSLNASRPGGLWAKRPKCAPIRDRAHQVNVANYILRHQK